MALPNKYQRSDDLIEWLALVYDEIETLIDQVPILGAAVGASGTTVDFTSIPSWVTKVDVIIDNLSSNGTSSILIRLGDSGGFAVSGYGGSNASLENAAAVACSNFTGAFVIVDNNIAAGVRQGIFSMVLRSPASNSWAASWSIGSSNNTRVNLGGGSVMLTSTLTQLRIQTANGVDTFDGGSLNIRYS